MQRVAISLILLLSSLLCLSDFVKAQSDGVDSDTSLNLNFQKVHEWSISMPLVIPMPVYPQLLSDGSLVIVDHGLKTINHFDRAGNLISTTGGEGRGPGEYQSISAASIRDDGKVAVADISSAAITVSDMYSEERHRTNIDPGWNMALQWAGDQLIYSSHPFKIMGGNRGDIIMTQFDSELESSEQVMRLELQRDDPPEDQISCMFCRFWFRDDVTFFTTPNDQRYLLYQVDPETDEIYEVSLDNIMPVEYSDAERDQIEESRQEAADRVGLDAPDEAPPRFKRMIVDMFIDHKERLWVQRHSAEGTSTVFDLFDQDRQFLGSVMPPEGVMGVLSVSGNRVLFSVSSGWGPGEDPDTWSAEVYEIIEE